MKSASLHERIRQDIEGRIMSGAWEAGYRIPPEHELMAEYNCSRMTVNKAISALVERRLVQRRKRAGSFVAAPAAHRAALDIPDIAAEIEAQARAHRIVVLARTEREATAEDCALLTIAAGPVLAISCLHLADRKPFALEDRRINLALVPPARDVDFSRESPGRWLLQHVPWTDAKHSITAIAASPEVAAALDLAEGAPCLSIERWTWRTAERITYVRQLYSGDYVLTASFIT